MDHFRQFSYQLHLLKTLFSPFFILLCFIPFTSSAIDFVRMTKEPDLNAKKYLYKKAILINALEATKAEYGIYRITSYAQRSSNTRAILEVKSGKHINVFMALTTPDWEENTLPIRVPIRRGILNYKLLTINKSHAERFKNSTSLSDLKSLRMGLRSGWAITPIFQEAGFNVVESNTFEGLFHMLSNDRIDYIPRGINEVFAEIEARKEKMPNLMVQPTLALTLPCPFYVFVSPTEPRLAKRLTLGLEIMMKNGTLTRLFNQYYAENIERANIEQRTMLFIDNHFLPEKTPNNISDFWFYNDK